MTDRAAARTDFLARTGWASATVTPLPGDASFRRYFRVAEPTRHAMLMDAPPPNEDVRPFMAIASILLGMGYSAPRIYEAEPVAGFLLLEDLGDETYTRVLAKGADERALYALATDLLADLHQRFEPATASHIPDYSDEKLLTEASLLTDWFLPAVLCRPVPDDVRAEYLGLWAEHLHLARSGPDTLVLRDYHIDNLMLLPDRAGLAACGLLDFQDAVIGPAAYDLVSLIEDARRDIAPELRQAMRDRYLERVPDTNPDALDLSLAVLGAQRHAKVIGIFCRLALRDGKPLYVRHLPRLFRLIERSLRHPALARLEHWMNRHIPAALRTIPERLAAMPGASA
jgi:aminoglycoside/choline kinase family phosphotransferase